jgi:DUF2934 family protein
MVSVMTIGVVTALAAAAVVAKKRRDKPKKANKSERGEILKQLLALSDHENRLSSIPSPPTRSHRLASASTARIETSQKRTRLEQKAEAVALPHQSKPPMSLRPNQPDTEIEEQIRQRAYELYQRHGGVDGNATDHWLRAKKEVLRYNTHRGTTPS